jgi:hypothetical protein
MALLLENQYQKFHKLTFKLTGDAFHPEGIEGMGSQTYAPIDIMRVPLVWVCKIQIESQKREVVTFKSLANSGA